MNRLICSLCFAIVFCSTTMLFAQNGKSTDTYYQTSEVQPVMANYEADKGILTRFYFIINSPERRERLKKLTNDYRKQLEQLAFDKMKTSGKVDYILFKRNLDNELRALDLEEKEYKAIYKYVSFGDPIYDLEKIRRRGRVMSGSEVVDKLSAMQQQMQSVVNELIAENGLLDMPLAIRAEATVNGLRNALRSMYEFYNGYDPQFTKLVPAPYA
ncbi:MAG: DUF885 domain-containing protein, partial [Sediminibacterium sp.]